LANEEKHITDSLSKVFNKEVVGFTAIHGRISCIQYVKNSREYELPLTRFRIEKPVNNVYKKIYA
jgi:hypothetical protein